MTNDDKPIRGLKAIADYLGLSEDAAQRRAAKRQIPAYKIGGRWEMRPSAYWRMIEKREAA